MLNWAVDQGMPLLVTQVPQLMHQVVHQVMHQAMHQVMHQVLHQVMHQVLSGSEWTC